MSGSREEARVPCSISVLAPVYNGESTLRRAIDSIFAGLVLPFEVVIVNDGSTDSTPSIIEKLKVDYPAVRSIDIAVNGGLRGALNRGLEAAAGDYVARLDADDVWHDRHLKQIREALDARPGVKLVSTAYVLSDGDLQVRRETRNHPWLAWDNFIAHSSACFDRRALIARGGYPAEVFEDYGAWIALIDDGADYLGLEEATVTVFRTPKSLSDIGRRRSLQERFRLQLRAWRKYRSQMTLKERLSFWVLIGLSGLRVRLA